MIESMITSNLTWASAGRSRWPQVMPLLERSRIVPHRAARRRLAFAFADSACLVVLLVAMVLAVH